MEPTNNYQYNFNGNMFSSSYPIQSVLEAEVISEVIHEAEIVTVEKKRVIKTKNVVGTILRAGFREACLRFLKSANKESCQEACSNLHLYLKGTARVKNKEEFLTTFINKLFDQALNTSESDCFLSFFYLNKIAVTSIIHSDFISVNDLRLNFRDALTKLNLCISDQENKSPGSAKILIREMKVLLENLRLNNHLSDDKFNSFNNDLKKYGQKNVNTTFLEELIMNDDIDIIIDQEGSAGIKYPEQYIIQNLSSNVVLSNKRLLDFNIETFNKRTRF